MKNLTRDIVIVALILVGGIGVGWFGNDLYKAYTNQRILDGFYLRNYNQSDIKDTAYEMDRTGDWVCVNIRGMDYKRGLEVCNHEMGHEIFAEECEKNITKCFDIG